MKLIKYLLAIAAIAAMTATAEARGRHHHRHHHHSARAHHHRVAARAEAPTPASYYAYAGSNSYASPWDSAQYNVGSDRPARSSARYRYRDDGTAGDLAQASYGGGQSLVRAYERYLGTNPTGMRRNWCRAMFNRAARAAGYRVSGDLRARAPVPGARRISRPMPGAVAQAPHHIGVVKDVSADGSRILLLSGNSGGRGRGHRTTTAHWRPAHGFRYSML